MGKQKNWWIVVFLWSTCFFPHSSFAQNKEIVRSGYYFVIQITEIAQGDTIRFETIEIYRAVPNIDLDIESDSIIRQNYVADCFRDRSFHLGCLKNARKQDVGKVVILNTTIDQISDSGIIIFKK